MPVLEQERVEEVDNTALIEQLRQENKELFYQNHDLRMRIRALEKENTHLSVFGYRG